MHKDHDRLAVLSQRNARLANRENASAASVSAWASLSNCLINLSPSTSLRWPLSLPLRSCRAFSGLTGSKEPCSQAITGHILRLPHCCHLTHHHHLLRLLHL